MIFEKENIKIEVKGKLLDNLIDKYSTYVGWCMDKGISAVQLNDWVLREYE